MFYIDLLSSIMTRARTIFFQKCIKTLYLFDSAALFLPTEMSRSFYKWVVYKHLSNLASGHCAFTACFLD